MKTINLIYILFHLLLLTSCNSENDQVLNNEYSNSLGINLELIEEIKIDISEYGYNIYDNKFVFKEGKNLFLLGYSGKSHQLDLINLTDHFIENSIILKKEGPNGIQNVFKIFVHNLDSIFIVDYQSLKILDIEGNIKLSLKSVFLESELIPEGNIINYNDADTFYDANSNKFYGFYFPFKNYEGQKLSEDTPLICSIDIKTGKLEFLPIKYPYIVRNNYNLVPQRMPNIKYINNKIFYGFPFLSDIYEFDLSTRKSKSYGGKSKYSDNISFISNDDFYNYRLTGTIFYNLEYIREFESYLRGHWGSQEIRQIDGTDSDNFTKKGYLIFFDKNLKYINEIKIDDSYWIEEYFVFDDHIYLYKKNIDYKEEDYLIFGKFKFIELGT